MKATVAACIDAPAHIRFITGYCFFFLGYLVTALGRIGDFQGGECLIYLSVTSIAVCARNGGAVGSWPYNVIRDFSCRDGNFSFTSGRRGPFGIGTYQFQLTPPVLAKLTSAVTMITGAQFGRTASPELSPKRQESSSPDRSTSPDQHSAPSDQATISNCSYADHTSKPHADNTYDRLSKPLHSSYSSSELKPSCTVQSQSPQPFKKQMSSPGPLRQTKRPCHHYEEMDLPQSGSSLSLASTLTPSPTTPSLANPTTHTGSNPSTLFDGAVCTSQRTDGKLCAKDMGPGHCRHSPVEPQLANSLGNAAKSVIYENVCALLAGVASEPSALAAGQQTLQHCALGCGRKDVVALWSDDSRSKCIGHSSGLTAQDDDVATTCKQGSSAEDMYDRPRASLHDVPAYCCDGGSGEELTLKARRGCTQIHSLALPTEGVCYDNVQSLKSCHLLAEDGDDGDLYEEIDSALVCPSAKLRHSFPDRSDSVCKPTYNMIAQQLATEEGYELVTSMRHAVSHNAGTRCVSNRYSLLADVRQRGPEKLYINHNLHKDPESNEESDGYVVMRSPNTPTTHSGLLAGHGRNQERVACHVSGPRVTPRRNYTNTVDFVPASECVAF